MSIPLPGPFTDTNPPRDGKKVKWKFTNTTGGPIHNLRIRSHNRTWSDDADMTKITIRNKAGQTVFQQSYPGVIDQGVGSAHCEVTQDIPSGEEFEVEIEFDDDIGEGGSIHFAPSDSSGAMIVAGIAPVSSVAALTSASLGSLIWHTTTLGGFLPIPVTTPVWIYRAIRLLQWLLRSMAGAAVLPPEEAAQEGEQLRFAPGASYTLGPGEDLRTVARSALTARLGREPKEKELLRFLKYTRLVNDLTSRPNPGDTVVLP